MKFDLTDKGWAAWYASLTPEKKLKLEAASVAFLVDEQSESASPAMIVEAGD